MAGVEAAGVVEVGAGAEAAVSGVFGAVDSADFVSGVAAAELADSAPEPALPLLA